MHTIYKHIYTHNTYIHTNIITYIHTYSLLTINTYKIYIKNTQKLLQNVHTHNIHSHIPKKITIYTSYKPKIRKVCLNTKICNTTRNVQKKQPIRKGPFQIIDKPTDVTDIHSYRKLPVQLTEQKVLTYQFKVESNLSTPDRSKAFYHLRNK